MLLHFSVGGSLHYKWEWFNIYFRGREYLGFLDIFPPKILRQEKESWKVECIVMGSRCCWEAGMLPGWVGALQAVWGLEKQPWCLWFLKKKITLLSHCWVPESCAGLQGESFVIIMTVYQSNSWKLIWLRNSLYGEKLPRKVGKKKRGMWSWLSQHPSKGVVRPQPFAGRTEWGCAQKKDPAPGVFSLLTGQGVRVALTVRGQVRCQQFLRVFWLQASQHQAHEEVGRL